MVEIGMVVGLAVGKPFGLVAVPVFMMSPVVAHHFQHKNKKFMQDCASITDGETGTVASLKLVQPRMWQSH